MPYNNYMSKTIPIQIKIPTATHNRVIELAKHVDCISNTGNPKAATAVTKTLRVVLNFYNDDTFQKCLENEGIDTLAFIQKSVRKQMKACIAEIENEAGKRKR